AARKGLGELFVGLNFGPLMVGGTVYALTGSLNWLDLYVGVPVSLLITAILWINQFPDKVSDEATGKHNLVVVLGRRRARWGYVIAVAGAVAGAGVGVLAGLVAAAAVLSLLGRPVAVECPGVLLRG